MKSRKILMISLAVFVLGMLAIHVGSNKHPTAQAAPDVYASPIHGGCYIAAPADCRIHVEPFTIYIQTGSKLVYFQLVASRVGSGSQVIYDFRPDTSNPLPVSGTSVTPSLVAQDYAATCGETYSINLQGRDTLDTVNFSLGTTGQFTCPADVP